MAFLVHHIEAFCTGSGEVILKNSSKKLEFYNYLKEGRITHCKLKIVSIYSLEKMIGCYSIKFKEIFAAHFRGKCHWAS